MRKLRSSAWNHFSTILRTWGTENYLHKEGQMDE